MAKKRKETNEEKQRQSRKEVLIARRHEQQTRRIWLLVIAVVALIVIVLLVGIINEVLVRPNRPVATVNMSSPNGVEITMKEWRDQVEYRRALLVSRINDIAGLVEGDVNQIQQIAGFELQALSDPETLGQQVLEEMVDQELVRQEAESRGIAVTDEEIQTALEERFSYFKGESPTPQPTATATIEPTPSLTPIARATITENLDLDTPTPLPTAGPTRTPLPTPTAVSLESFQEASEAWFDLLNDYGVNEELFRSEIEQQLYREKLIELLASSAEVADEAEKASIFYIRIDDEDEANIVLDEISDSDYLSVWNRVNSRLEGEDSESTAFAGELLWRTSENLSGVLGEEVGKAAFDLDVEIPSGIIVVPSPSEDESDTYFIIMVSGREMRPLTEAELDNAKQQVFTSWLDAARLIDVVIFERWRAYVPQRPLPDTSSWIYPTPVPTSTPGDAQEILPQPTAE